MELKMIWEEFLFTYTETPYRHFIGRTENIHTTS